MATGTIKRPVNIKLASVNEVSIIYNPNYGEIIGFEVTTVDNHLYSIYFNKTQSKIDFYKDSTLIWSK